MSANLQFPLTLDYVRTAPISALSAALTKWLAQTNPVCLLHPHGFYVVLLERNELEEWRFHFWPRGPRAVTRMPAFIHTHDRHVESRVLQGQLTNTLSEVAEVPSGGRPLYEVGYDGDRHASETSNVLRHTGTRVSSAILCHNTVQRGNTYHVELHAYHEVTVPNHVATSTLVCMHGRAPGAVMVVGLDGYPETIAFKRTERRADDFLVQLST